MATIPRPSGRPKVEYPTSDGKPMAETDVHRDLMVDLIETLRDHFAADPLTYVSGNILLFYEEGNKRKHVAPDVLVAHGVPKLPARLYYLLWEEPKGPDCIIELTSKTARNEDQRQKWVLYRDVLKIPEYFLFDPFEDYLKPSMQGYRLVGDEYEVIAPTGGRLASVTLGLHLEREGTQLRIYDSSGRRLPTSRERIDAAEANVRAEASERQRAEDEAEQLRRQIEALQRRLGDQE